MLKRAITIVLGAVLLAAHAVAASPRDYLARGWSEKPLDFEIEYNRAIERVLERAFRREVVLRMVLLPPFDPEGTIGIARSRTGYTAFDLQPSTQIWEALHEKKRNLSALRAVERERRIATPLAIRFMRVWREVLEDRRNYRPPEKNVLFVDSWHFVFFVDSNGGPSLTANTNRSDPGTKTAELISLGDAIYRYVRRGMSDRALEARLRAVEAKLGLAHTAEASNQAMQRTVGRFAFPLSMTSTSNQQPPAPSPAVADLGSR